MKFDLDRKGLLAILNGDDAVALVDRAADAAADEARRIAPHGRGRGRRFTDSIGTTSARRTARGAVGAVTTSDPFWHLVEFGSVNNPPYRPLTRAVKNVGLDFDDKGR